MEQYVINNELTSSALMEEPLLRKCSFKLGAENLVIISSDSASKVKKQPVEMQHWQRFVQTTYPDGKNSNAMIIPGCVMHHDVHTYYETPAVYVGIPMSFVGIMGSKLDAATNHLLFEDKTIHSDSTYWWTRVARNDAGENQEFIRVDDGEGEEGNPDDLLYFPSFSAFFRRFKTSVVCNLTCTLRFKCSTEVGTRPDKKTEWRAAIQVQMITPYDAIEVDKPAQGAKQTSAIGPKDRARPGLLKFKAPA